MRLIHRFYMNVNLLNILLVLSIAAIASFVLFPQFLMQARLTLPAAKPRAAVMQELPAADIQAPPLQDFTGIGENNLFHPERKLIKEVKPLPKPELILYGTIIGDGLGLAFIEDKKAPKTSAGRGKRQTVVKKGEIISGFIVQDIEADRIVLRKGDESIVVYITDTGKQRETETTLSSSKPAAPVPSAGTLLKPSAAAPSAVPPKPQAAPAVSAPAPAKTPTMQANPPPQVRGRGNYSVRTPGQSSQPGQ